MMHAPINVKSPNTTSKWQMEFNSAFRGLSVLLSYVTEIKTIKILIIYAGALNFLY
jgi:hypothetical protein